MNKGKGMMLVKVLEWKSTSRSTCQKDRICKYQKVGMITKRGANETENLVCAAPEQGLRANSGA